MKRVMMAAVAVALALPVVTLAAMIGDAERGLRDAGTIRVAIRGYDPRDMLRGHYVRYQFAWNADLATLGRVERLCVLSAPADAPARVRPVIDGSDTGTTADCLFMLKGSGHVGDGNWRRRTGEAGTSDRLSFAPMGAESGELYLSQERAKALEKILIEGKVPVTIDLAVARSGRAAVRAWHIDGRTPDAYFAK